ncbi:MAG: hypothetical protein JZU60_02150 [Ilumatobacteraceae bacterium]|jgi:hypothetical protein|nr:hypothetical protein [Ilumatobacteraceae bacterium]
MEYPINSDYRTALAIILAFEDETLTGYEQQAILLSNLYDDIPSNTQAAINQANKFLNGGKTSEDEPQSALRLYSFSKDAGYIFAAFRQTHGIDLQKADLHWWEFLTLFMDLGADTTFVNLIGLRKRIKTGTASKEERQAARDMGDLFDIPEIDTRTLSEKEAESEFMKLVSQP